MISPQRNFRTLKQLVSIEHVLTHRQLIARMRRRNDDFVGPCPIHHGDNPMAFVVSRSKNLWRCFTGCDAGGDVVELVRRLDQTSYARVAEYLADLARLPLLPLCHNEPCYTSTRKPFVPFTRDIPLDPETDLLRRKAIYPRTARHFEVGLYRGQGFLQRSIGVRIHDPQARPLGYAARHLDPCDIRRHGKWKFPPRLPKSRVLYNFHRIRAHHPKDLVLLECPWGVMRLHQIAIPAVALLGTHLSFWQRQLLLPIPHLIVMMDGDSAGRQAATRIRQQLHTQTKLSMASVPDGLDPDQLTDDRLKAILRPFLF